MRDNLSEQRLLQCHPKVRDTFKQFIEECENSLNITLRIMLPVYRSVKEQNDLYAQGRTTPGKVVTNAKGGTSFHNFGLAIDIVEMDNQTEINWLYDNSKLEPIAKKYELEWGGDWVHIKDRPHFEKRFGFKEDCSDLRLLPTDNDGYPIF